MAYNKDQWTSSFEDRLSILRPHLSPRVLASLSLPAWHARGRRDEDPVEAADAVHRELEARAKAPRR